MPPAERPTESTLSVERQLALFNDSPVVVYTCEAHGGFAATHIGPGIRRQLGWEPEEFLGTPGFWADNIHPDDRERVFAGLEPLFNDGRHFHEYRFRHKDGSYRWMRDELFLEYDDSGAPDQIVGYWTDITGQKRAEEVLHEREAMLQLITDGVPALIDYVGLDGRIRFANKRFAEWFGRDREEVIGMHIKDVRGADAHEANRRQRERVLAGEEVSYEGERRFGEDTRHYRATHIPHFGEDGEVHGYIALVVDITEPRRVGEALRHSEERFRAVFDNSPSAVSLVDSEGRFLLTNREFQQRFRLTEDEIIGRTAHQLHEPEFAEFYAQGNRDVLKENRTIRRVIDQVYPDGQPRTNLVVKFPIRGEDGAPVAVGTVNTDITEIERMRDALRLSEERYRRLVELSPDGIMVHADGIITFANATMAQILGVDSADDIVGKPAIDFVPPEDREAVVERRAQATRDKALGFRETTYRRADGSTIDVERAIAEITWQDEASFLVMTRDITERKRAADAVKDSERRFRDLIEGSKLGIQIASRGGKRLFVNQAYLEMTGYDSLDEVVALPAGALVAPHDRERLIQYRIDRFDGREKSAGYEFDGLRKDRTTMPLEAVTRLIVWDGQEAIQRTFIDLTQRRRAEEQLRQAQKMEAVGQLTGGVAHDFNNLLTVVLGNLQLFEARLGDDDEARRHIATAMRAVRRGADLTQMLLAFSRRQRLAPTAVAVHQLVAGMGELLHRTLGEQIEIETVETSPLPPAMVDAAQLENAILNLALNARDAMPDGGLLTIETTVEELDAADSPDREDTASGRYVVVTVSDDGFGMAPSVLEHAIEPFFTTKDTGKGSGLGLSMVYGFAKQSGGHAEIDSDPDSGTTVRLYLPVATGENVGTAPHESAPQLIPTGSESILVVEDDMDVRNYVVNALRKLGYQVLEAADGPDALALLDGDRQIDLLFTDMVLPGGLNGSAVAEEAVKRRPGIKVVFTSGYTRHLPDNRKAPNGDGGFLPKPHTQEVLAKGIRDALDGEAR